MTDVAALLGALGAVAVLLAGRRVVLLGGFAVVAAAELLLARAGGLHVSAKLAAAAVLDLLGGTAQTLLPYESAVDAALMPLHNASWKLKRALDRWPRASWRIARTRLLWKTVERLLQGELSAPGEQHGVARIPLRALEALGRRA
jgi:hypothetical protein